MANARAKPKSAAAGSLPELAASIVAEISEIDAEGHVYVRFPGGGETPVRARIAFDRRTRGDGARALLGARALVVFENGDRALPIVVDVLRDRIESDAPRELTIDGDRLLLEARHEVTLRCGKASIVLRRDGKVLIRGAHVVSRSSGPNKVKGTSIDLN